MIQLCLFDHVSQAGTECQHLRRMETHAVVPAGVYCFDCDLLLSQKIPRSPEQLGYLSGDWEWHTSNGNAWKTQDPRTKELLTIHRRF